MKFLLNLLDIFAANETAKALLKSFAKVVATRLRQAGAQWTRNNVVGKFIKVATVGGRVYALYVSETDEPPEGHPKAWLLHTADLLDVEVYLFGVSFPKKRWENLPAEQKAHIKL